MKEKSLIDAKYWDVFLTEDQTYFGRLVVVLKRPCEALSSLENEEHLEFLELVKKIESFYKKKYKATMFNYSCLMNDAYKDKTNPQLHFHVRPRYSKEIMFCGEKFFDPNFGYHYISTNTGINKKLPLKIKRELVNSFKEIQL